MTITLYPYQKEAVETMKGKPSYLESDDMGLGKTVITLAEMSETLGGFEGRRVLIVCPNSVKGVWSSHVAQMIPEARVHVIGNTNHRTDAAKFHDDPDANVLIVHWDALRILSRLPQEKWDAIIADEAAALKNRKTLRTKALKKLRATYKRALTGTPMINRPDDLWSILHWLWPRDFGSYWKFFHEFSDAVKHPQYGFWMFKGPKNEPALHALLTPRMVRRKKSEVLKDLPEKYVTTLEVDLDPKQRRAYDEMKRRSLAVVEPGTPVAAPVALAQLTRLRQFADSYIEVSPEGAIHMAEPSPKLDALMELVESMNGRPVVVFSMFRQMIDLASARLKAADVDHRVMIGDTPSETRTEMIADFQAGKFQALLATIQTGGVGITLTAADTAIFLDESWSPADNAQAQDRLHRIGQRNAVQIIKIQSKNTVDQVVVEKLRRKGLMFSDIIEGGKG